MWAAQKLPTTTRTLTGWHFHANNVGMNTAFVRFVKVAGEAWRTGESFFVEAQLKGARVEVGQEHVNANDIVSHYECI